MRPLLLFLAFAPLSVAQFSWLATPDDGKSVYFTSTLRLKGTDRSALPRVWRWSNAGFEVIAEPVDTEAGLPLWYIQDVAVSGDGRILTYRAIYGPSGGRTFGMSYLHSPDRVIPIRSTDQIQVSHNGRYAATYEGRTEPIYLFDLEQGRMWKLPFASVNRLGLTDDGRVLWRNQLWSVQGTRTLDDVADSGVISTSGKWIASTRMRLVRLPGAFFMRLETRHDLILTDVETGQSRLLIDNTLGPPLRITGFSADDKLLIYGNQLWPLPTGVPTTLGTGQYAAFAVSAAGDVAYEVSQERGFVRTRPGLPDETLVPPIGMYSLPENFFVVPGSARIIPVTDPAPQLMLGGMRLPQPSREQLEVVIPVDVPIGDQLLVSSAPSASPFEQAPAVVQVLRQQLYWLNAFPGTNFEPLPSGEPWPRADESVSFVVGGVGRNGQTLLPVQARFREESTGRLLDLGPAVVALVAQRPGAYRVTVTLRNVMALAPGPDGRHTTGFVELGPGDLGPERGWLRMDRMNVRLR